MTTDDIIRMAWEAGLEREDDDSGEWSAYDDELLKFARKIAAAEREACAQVCEANSHPCREFIDQASICAADIRARGEKKEAA